MGARKRNKAKELKEKKKTTYSAALNNCPTSPRKMRLMADLIRGEEVNKALDILRYSSKESSGRLEKLVLSAIANWQAKNEDKRLEDTYLVIQEIFVDSARQLKRIRPAPQGRAHRIRKRSNHVTVILGTPEAEVVEENETVKETK